MNINKCKLLNTMKRAAKASGKVLTHYFGKTIDVVTKSSACDYQTTADTESEKAILSVLQKNYPKYNILSEECGWIDNGSKFTFIIDPMDGTNNFMLGIPNFTISIGLVQNYNSDKTLEILAGVICCPMLKIIYYAKRNMGAYMNGVKIKVNDEGDLKKSTIVYTCGYDHNRLETESIVSRLRKVEIKRLLDNWSPAFDYCLLASGKIEAIINDNNEIYDFCAGKLIAMEAGAEVENGNIYIDSNQMKIGKKSMHSNGKIEKRFICTNGRITQKICEVIKFKPKIV